MFISEVQFGVQFGKLSRRFNLSLILCNNAITLFPTISLGTCHHMVFPSLCLALSDISADSRNWRREERKKERKMDEQVRK